MRCEALVLLLVVGCEPPPGAASFEAACADCHPAQTEAHAASRHATAGTGAVFTALRARQEERTQIFCDACHRPEGQPGLRCLTCHAALGNSQDANGALVWDRDGPIRGAGLGGGAPHPVRSGGIFQSAELCGTCHQVEHGAFSESPLSHWRASPAAARGETCADCHLVPRHPGPAATGGAERALVEHRPRGLLGEQAVALMRSAVALEVEERDGQRLAVLTALADGHELPDGASFSRALWIQAPGLRVELGTRLYAGDERSYDPGLADRSENDALAPGTVRRWALPERGAVCLHLQRVRPELLALLALPMELAGPVETVLCAE